MRKFTIPARERQIKLWVFTPDLLVSTSAIETNEPVRVAKVLWREEDVPDGGEDIAAKLSRQALSEGELALGEEDAQQLVQSLQDSSKWLPKESRHFAEWEVGLLERFSKSDFWDR